MNNKTQESKRDSEASLNKLVLEMMQDRKRERRNRFIFRLSAFVILIFLCLIFFFDFSKDRGSSPHVGLIELEGEVAENKEASAENFIKSLNKAYRNKGLKALIISINSPGGSPVQADYMYQALMDYRKSYPAVNIYAVCTDLCTSAAYYVATAADAVYANESSLVGSIGVIYNGFGFTDAIQKLGISRRLQTAGANKGFMDPFLPESPEQKALLQKMLDDIHQIFIDRVKMGRGGRLKVDDQTFSGLFWTGLQAKDRGLIDGFGSIRFVAANIVKLSSIVDYTHKQSVMDRLSKKVGVEIANQLPAVLGMEKRIRF